MVHLQAPVRLTGQVQKRTSRTCNVHLPYVIRSSVHVRKRVGPPLVPAQTPPSQGGARRQEILAHAHNGIS